MSTANHHSKPLAALGYAALLALLALSILFYRERALFTDIAYQTFLMINDGGVQVMVYRFGAAVVQLLPLLAIKLEAPLWVISLLYSMSFPLLFLFFYWVIVRVLRNEQLGWALVLLFILIVYDGFYWPSSEQQQGLAFLLVFWAFVLRFPRLDRWWKLLLAGLGVIALAFYHPLVFIPFFFLWGYFGWRETGLRHGRFLGLALFMILVLFLKSQLAANWYDTGKYGNFLKNLVEDFPNYFSYPSHRKFLHNAILYWYGLPVALTALTFFYLKNKRWVLLAWVWAFVIGHLMLLHIGSPDAPYRFYSEVNYLPLTLYAIVPLLMEWARPRWTKRWLFYLLLGVVGFRLAVIGLHHRPFTERVTWMEEKLDRGPNTTNRYFIPRSSATDEVLIMDWGVAYESLLLSAMEHPDSAKTLLVLPDAGHYPDLFRSDTTFHSALKRHELQELNPRYFRLGRNKYEVLE